MFLFPFPSVFLTFEIEYKLDYKKMFKEKIRLIFQMNFNMFVLIPNIIEN